MELNLEKIINDVVEKRVSELKGAKQPILEDNAVVFTPQEAVEFLGGGVSYSTLMRECRRGNMPCFHVGKKVYFRKNSLIQWIENQELRVRQEV